MIGYLKGEVAAIFDDRIILEVGGIGYNIFMPSSSLELIERSGITLRIYTYLLVREDTLALYGFLTRDDLEMYKLLISVSGVGPKGALALMSVMTIDEIRFAILAGDAKAIGKAPGIGPKTAQRVIIDLKDKTDLQSAVDASFATGGLGNDKAASGGVRDEAAQALVALGYSQTEAYRAVRSVGNDNDDVESVLKKALSVMAKL